MPTSTTIAVATHKGGAGKTVTALALSAAFARAGNRTLLVDLDPQGHATLGVGVSPGPTAPTIREVLVGDPAFPIGRAAVPSTVPNLDVVPSTIRLERAAVALYTRSRREVVLDRALATVRDAYRFVVLDCPPSLGVLTETAIAAASLVVIPAQMEARAADGLVDLLGLVQDLRGEDFDAWRILLTRMDRRRSVMNEAVRGALEGYRAKMFRTEIPQSEPLNHAQLVGRDIFGYDPSCAGAVAYRGLVAELVKVIR